MRSIIEMDWGELAAEGNEGAEPKGPNPMRSIIEMDWGEQPLRETKGQK